MAARSPAAPASAELPVRRNARRSTPVPPVLSVLPCLSLIADLLACPEMIAAFSSILPPQ
jgi:hypothetical protein